MSLYFDHNATAPLRDSAIRAWTDASASVWANPSALYPSALAAKAALERARETIAALLACTPGRIVFTSGATEANNAVFSRFCGTGAPCAVSAIEHPSVIEGARAHFGQDVLILPVGAGGWIDIAGAAEIIYEKRPALVSAMAANSETGVVQPWLEIASVCRECAVPFHCDAVQLFGRIPIGDIAARADYLTFSAHKIGGPRGVGILLVPPEDNRIHAQHGGRQEAGRRAGTENVAAILAASAAFEEAAEEVSTGLAARQHTLRSAFEARMKALGTIVAGESSPRLPQTSMLLMPRHANTSWVTRLGKLGFECGTGSACGSGKLGPSHVLSAMKFPEALARRSVRVSAAAATKAEDWDALADAFERTLAELDAEAGTSSVVAID